MKQIELNLCIISKKQFKSTMHVDCENAILSA